MPTTATATVLVATTVATGLTVSDTAMDSTTARGRLSLRLMPTTATATVLVATTVATGLTVWDTAMDSTTARGRLRLSPTTVSTLLITLLPLPDATSPTPPE